MLNSVPEISTIDPDQEAELECIAELHMELLDYGPMAGLGLRFIRDVGYKIHTTDGLLQVALCRVAGEAAGFVAYTAQSISFHRQSLQSHFLRVCWTLALSILESPSRLVKLIRALKVVRSRRREKYRGNDPLGEIVAIAVRRKFLGSEFVDDQNRRISVALVAFAQRQLEAQGVKQMRMLVDSDNKSALMLYHLLGARMQAYEQAGEPMVEVWFELNPSDATDD